MYLPPGADGDSPPPAGTRGAGDTDINKWVQHFTSCENRHALPIFTSLLNTVCSYEPSGILPYNHILFNDSREETVEVALQVNYPKQLPLCCVTTATCYFRYEISPNL